MRRGGAGALAVCVSDLDGIDTHTHTHTHTHAMEGSRTGGEGGGAADEALEADGHPLAVLDRGLELLHLLCRS
jgi:hypothetical protein